MVFEARRYQSGGEFLDQGRGFPEPDSRTAGGQRGKQFPVARPDRGEEPQACDDDIPLVRHGCALGSNKGWRDHADHVRAGRFRAIASTTSPREGLGGSERSSSFRPKSASMSIMISTM